MNKTAIILVTSVAIILSILLTLYFMLKTPIKEGMETCSGQNCQNIIMVNQLPVFPVIDNDECDKDQPNIAISALTDPRDYQTIKQPPGHIYKQDNLTYFVKNTTNSMSDYLKGKIYYNSPSNKQINNQPVKCLWTSADKPDTTCGLGNGSFVQNCSYKDGTIKACPMPGEDNSNVQNWLKDYDCQCGSGKTYNSYYDATTKHFSGKNCQYSDNITCNTNGYLDKEGKCICNPLFSGLNCEKVSDTFPSEKSKDIFTWGNVNAGTTFQMYPDPNFMNGATKISYISMKTNCTQYKNDWGRKTTGLLVEYKNIYSGEIITNVSSPNQLIVENKYSIGDCCRAIGSYVGPGNNTELTLKDNEWIFRVDIYIGTGYGYLWDENAIRGLRIWYGSDPKLLKTALLGDATSLNNDPKDPSRNCWGTSGDSLLTLAASKDYTSIPPDPLKGYMALSYINFYTGGDKWNGLLGIQLIGGWTGITSMRQGPLYSNTTIKSVKIGDKDNYCIGIDNTGGSDFSLFPVCYSSSGNDCIPLSSNDECNNDNLSKLNKIKGDKTCSTIIKKLNTTLPSDWKEYACKVQPERPINVSTYPKNNKYLIYTKDNTFTWDMIIDSIKGGSITSYIKQVISSPNVRPPFTYISYDSTEPFGQLITTFTTLITKITINCLVTTNINQQGGLSCLQFNNDKNLQIEDSLFILIKDGRILAYKNKQVVRLTSFSTTDTPYDGFIFSDDVNNGYGEWNITPVQ